MPQDNQQASEKTREQLWAELDAADGATGTAAAKSQAQQLSDADLEAAAADASHASSQQEPGSGAAEEAAPQGGQAASETASTSAEDPYASLPQAVRDELAGLKQIVSQIGTRLRNAEGHIGGINHQLKSHAKAAATAQAEGHRAPTAEQLANAKGDRKALAKLKEEYPEFGAALEAVLQEEREAGGAVQATAAQTNQLPQGTEGMTPQQIQERMDQLERKMAIEAVHRGWEARVATPAFRGWLGRQPREVQLLGASDDPQDAIRLLDLHAEASKPSQTRQQRLNTAAALPNGRTSAGARPKDPSTMSKAELWAYLDQQEAAQQRG